MSRLLSNLPSLRQHLGSRSRDLADKRASIVIPSLATQTRLGRAALQALRRRSVLLITERQLTTILALVELDGVARRLVLWPPGLHTDQLARVVADAEIEALITDDDNMAIPPGLPRYLLKPDNRVEPAPAEQECPTEWVLFTSGTTGEPKMVVHGLESLTAPLAGMVGRETAHVWSTFYDIRRYGGLTICLRALVGGAGLILSEPGEATADFLERARKGSVTHISGTPSHWRRVLMCPSETRFGPANIRISGEAADQPLLDRLKAAFPKAAIAHAFASTEAGFVFTVTDALAGFPAGLLSSGALQPEMKILDGSLRVRSPGAAKRYLGNNSPNLHDAQRFIDTGDMLNRQGDRYFFAGRRNGTINVGGLKVHPELVEAIINRHPAVSMSRVRGRRSPLTGEVVVADVVATPAVSKQNELVFEILAACRGALPRHMIPASVSIVPALRLLETGKLDRRVA